MLRRLLNGLATPLWRWMLWVFKVFICAATVERLLEAVEDTKKAVERARHSIVALDALGIQSFYMRCYSRKATRGRRGR
jgi:hypothetical protein